MKKKAFLLSFIVLVLCAVMALVDGVFMADYFIKSGIKLVLFLGIPLIYAFLDKEVTVKNIFKIDKNGILPAILMGLLVYGVIVGGYFLLRGVFDFTKITGALTKNIGVTGKNFIFVSIYIAFVNSLLEEFLPYYQNPEVRATEQKLETQDTPSKRPGLLLFFFLQSPSWALHL